MSAPTVPTAEEDRSEPPFDVALVEEMLRQLDKTVRAYQLYLHNNPTYLKSLDALRATFPPLWAETESLSLHVADTHFIWYGVAVHSQPEKASDSLPWTMYKDGVRELTLTAGFEGDELEVFLAIIPRARKAQDHEEDLLTLLWEQEFAHLTYRYVDVSSDPGVPLDTTGEAGRWPVPPGYEVQDPSAAVEEARREAAEQEAAKEGDAQEETQERTGGIISMDDFDSTLYFLDSGEVAYLRSETEREYATDVRRTVLNALLDVFELQPDPAIRKEVAQHLDSLALHLLAGRQFANVAYLLREIDVVLERAKDLPPDVRARLAALPDRLSDPAALTQLIAAMDEAETLPPQQDLADLFGQLRPVALGTLFAWLGQTQNARLRPLLAGAAERLASQNTNELVRLIASTDPVIAMEAVKRSGGLKAAAAVPAITRILGEPDRDLRSASVAALSEIGTAGALQALDKALDDTDREVRLAAMRALAAKAYKPAFTRASQMVKSKDMRDADRTERLALFELYGILCGDGGVSFLDELLNGRGGLFARKEDPEIRACAAVALGKIATQRAQDSLHKALGERDVIVRSAVARSLRGGGAA